jgi:hypothetical protein
MLENPFSFLVLPRTLIITRVPIDSVMKMNSKSILSSHIEMPLGDVLVTEGQRGRKVLFRKISISRKLQIISWIGLFSLTAITLCLTTINFICIFSRHRIDLEEYKFRIFGIFNKDNNFRYNLLFLFFVIILCHDQSPSFNIIIITN